MLAGPSSNGGQPTLTCCHLHRSLPYPTYFACDLRVPTHHRLAKKKGSSQMRMYCLECSLEMGWVLWREQHRGRCWGYMVVKKVVTGEGERGRVPSQIPNPTVHYAIVFSLLNSSQAEPGSQIPNLSHPGNLTKSNSDDLRSSPVSTPELRSNKSLYQESDIPLNH